MMAPDLELSDDFNADITLGIDYKGIKASEKGSALFEIMMLR